MFDDVVVLTEAEYDAYVIACHETEFGNEYPDAADFVRDERQRFFDSRARLLCTGAAHLDDAMAAAKQVAHHEASRARALADFARSRPAAMFDRAPGERGAASAESRAARPAALTDVSEWAVDEAAATLRLSGRAASLLLNDAVTLVEGLPATLAALAAGDISPALARVMVEVAGLVTDADKRREVEEAVLPRAAGQTPAALKASVRRAVTRIDAAAAAERLVKAVRDRNVRLDTRDDGMSAMTTEWTTPVGRACYEALSAYATACEFDEEGNRDPRSHAERMADCHADLILRPHADHPAVKVAMTLVAGVDTMTGQGEGADEPAELDGDLVSAAQTRELAYQFGLMPRLEATAEAASDHPSAPAVESAEPVDSAASAESVESPGHEEPAARLAELRAEELAAAEGLLDALAATQRRQVGARSATADALTRLLDTRRLIDTALAERPRIAVVDRLSGTLLALTDGTGIRAAVAAGRGLGPPSGTAAYQPTDPLYRFTRLRDRRCRFPGCRARARCCDLDHTVPHPHGETAHDNLACLCEHHHRLSHQAPGWRLHRNADGGLVWTLPSGRKITTYPPAFGTDDGRVHVQAPARPTRRERYADALAAVRNSEPAPPDPDIPF